jgi:hypothetical protein
MMKIIKLIYLVSYRTYTDVSNNLFSCCLFNDGFSVTQTTQRPMKERQVNGELEMMWKEVVVA